MSFLKTYARAIGMLAAERWLSLVLVLANVAIGIVQLAEPILFGRVVDMLSRYEGAFPVIGLWAALGLFSIVAGVIVAVSADRLAHRQRLAAMGIAFERAITMPIYYHAERGSGSVIRAILAGTDALFMLWLALLREHLAALVSIVLLAPTALAMNVKLTAILGALACVYVLSNVLVVRRTMGGQATVERYHQSVFGRVGDVLGNVTVVQSFARLGAEVAALRSLMGELLSAQYPVLTWWALLTVLTRAAATIAMVAIFAFGAVLVSRREITVGEIVSFVGFAGLLIGKLDQLSGFVSRIFTQAPTLQSFFELVDSTSGIKERARAKPLKVSQGEIRYEGVSYQFPGTSQGVFDITFQAKPAQTVALVGPTGSGKTTTVALLQRLRSPTKGKILIDGQDIRNVTLDSLRQCVAVVFQEAGLFNRSIAENIRVGRPTASDTEVEAAARLAEAHDFIMAKPAGYGFVIGEKGASLSGGERQRLAIARAVLKNAPVLILDEATSALDVETEARIQRALDSIRQGRTTLIIAHRLSTVKNADQIVVLQGGRIQETGTFTQLVALGGLFARMVKQGGFVQPAD